MSLITNISVVYNVALVNVYNLPVNLNMISEIFNAIAREKINVDMISQSPPFRGSISLSFSISSNDLVKTIRSLNQFKKEAPGLQIEVDTNNTKLSVYGEEMKNIPGVAAKLYTILAENGIEIKLITTSEVDISYLIFEKDVDRAIEAVKKEYQSFR